jgi:hypothetical protein
MGCTSVSPASGVFNIHNKTLAALCKSQVLTRTQAVANERFPQQVPPKVPAGGYTPGYCASVQLILSATAPRVGLSRNEQDYWRAV